MGGWIMGKNKFKPKPPVKDPVPEPELLSEFSGVEPEKEPEPYGYAQGILQRRDNVRFRRVCPRH